MNAPTLRPEAGKFYKTRAGQKAYVEVVSKGNPFRPDPAVIYTVRGYTEESGSESWTLYGEYYSGREAPQDLVAEWAEPKRVTGWLNLYAIGHLSKLHETREAADREAGIDRIACIEIAALEGQGLEEEAGR